MQNLTVTVGHAREAIAKPEHKHDFKKSLKRKKGAYMLKEQ